MFSDAKVYVPGYENGFLLSSMGAIIKRSSSIQMVPPITLGTAHILGRPGELVGSRTVGPRQIQLDIHFSSEELEENNPFHGFTVDELDDFLTRLFVNNYQPFEIEFTDLPGRYYEANFDDSAVPRFYPADGEVGYTLVCHDPYVYGDLENLQGDNGDVVGKALNLGTEVVEPTIVIDGADLAPSISWDPYEVTDSQSANPPTFTRPSTAYDQAGNEVAIDTPRYEDAATGFGKAVMMEEGTQNVALYSKQLDDATWGKWHCTVTADAATAPDGSTDADRIVETNDTDAHTVYQAVAGGANEAFAVTLKKGERTWAVLIVKIGGGSYVRAWFDLDSGVKGACSSGTSYMESRGNGWYKCVFVPASAYTEVSFGPCTGNAVVTYPGDNTKGIYAWQVQVEAQPYATSDVPTVAAPATRAAETLTIPKAVVLSNTKGSVQCRVKPLRAYGTNHQFVFDGGGAANRNLQVYIDAATGKPTLVYGDGAAEITIISSGAAVASGTHYGIGWRWGTAGVTMYIDGVPVGTNATPPWIMFDANTYRGSKADGTLQFDGLIYDGRVSSRARTDAEFLADYIIGVPLPIEWDTTHKLSLNDSLYPTEWRYTKTESFTKVIPVNTRVTIDSLNGLITDDQGLNWLPFYPGNLPSYLVGIPIILKVTGCASFDLGYRTKSLY